MFRTLRKLLSPSKNQNRALKATEKAIKTSTKTDQQSQPATKASNSSLQRSSTSWTFRRIDEQPYDSYHDAIDDIKRLKREKEHAQVRDLLNWCIDYAESEARHKGYSEVPRAYYRHLAIVQRKDGDYEGEVSTIERYLNTVDRLGGTPYEEMEERLVKAKQKADNQS